MISFDIQSFICKKSSDKTIKIVIQKLFKNKKRRVGLKYFKFLKPLKIATQESQIHFRGNYFNQKYGASMGSPLAPTHENIFVIELENFARVKK